MNDFQRLVSNIEFAAPINYFIKLSWWDRAQIIHEMQKHEQHRFSKKYLAIFIEHNERLIAQQ